MRAMHDQFQIALPRVAFSRAAAAARDIEGEAA
jgi:hypothetical protein